MYVRDKGVMTGVNATLFAPGENLQRQDIALALMRRYISQGHTVIQKDDGTYYGKAVAWAKDMKIMTGYSNGDFGVGDVITRQDCITALDRYVDQNNMNMKVVSEILGHYSEEFTNEVYVIHKPEVIIYDTSEVMNSFIESLKLDSTERTIPVYDISFIQEYLF